MTVAIPAVVNMDPTAVDDEYSISEDIDAANSGTQRVVFTAGNVITGDPNSANAGADEDSDGMVSDLRVTFYASGEDVAAAIGNDEQVTAAATFNTNLNASVVNAISAGEPPRMRMQMQTNGAFRLVMLSDDSRYQALPAGTDAEEKFSYRVTDMGTPPGTDDGVLTITITGVNDAPTVVDTLPAVAPGTPGGTYSQPLAGFFEDVDTGEQATLTYALSEACTGFVIGGTGNGFLVGSDSGDIPSTVTTNTTCKVTASDAAATSPAADLAVVINADNKMPVSADDSFGISSTHTATLSGNVLTGVAGTGLTTEAGATDIMLAADTDDGGASNLRVTRVSTAINADGSLNLDEAQFPRSTGTTLTFLSGQGTLTINETGAFTYTPPTGDFRFFLGSPATLRAIAAGETGTLRIAYRIADMGSPALFDDGVLTITVTAPAAANTVPTLTAAASPDITVTEDDNANNTAGGSFTVADTEQDVSADEVTVQRCVDAVAGTACTVFANAATGNIGGIYGNFTLTNAGAWTYTLDNQCGTTPGIQGATADAGEANDPGCATDALAGAATASDVLRIRADDGTADATTAAGSGTSRYSTTEVVTVTITGVNDAPQGGQPTRPHPGRASSVRPTACPWRSSSPTPTTPP